MSVIPVITEGKCVRLYAAAAGVCDHVCMMENDSGKERA